MLLLKHPRRLLVVSVMACFSSFTFGYDQGVINPLLQFLHNQTNQEQPVLILFPAGALFGSLLAFIPTEKWGRRFTLMCNCVLSCLGCVVAAFGLVYRHHITIALFYIGRFISGVSTGISSFLVPLYIKELTAGKNFGSIGSIHQIMITLGITAAYLLGVLCYYGDTHHDSWAIVLAPMLVSMTEGAFFRFILTYESPVFLWHQGQRKKAIEVVNFINTESMPLPLDSEEEETEGDPAENPSFFEVLTKERYRTPMCMGCGLSLFQQFGGVNVIIMTASIILQNGIDVSPGWLVVIVGAFNTLSALLTLFFIDNIKRTLILQIGGMGMAIAMGLLAISAFDSSNHTILALCGCCLFTVMFEISIGTVQWFYNAELLPPKGLAVATATNWGGNTVIGVLCASVLEGPTGKKVLYLLFACVNVLLVVFSGYLIETKDMSPEDLEERLKSSIKHKALS